MSGGTRQLAVSTLALAMMCVAGSVCDAQAKNPVEIGCNVERIRDWSRSEAFVDVVKQSRGFFRAGTALIEPANKDVNGWPTEDFDIILMTDVAGVQNVAGTYKVSGFSATTPSIFGISGIVTVSNVSHSPFNQKFSADVTLAPGSAGMILGFRNTGTGVRDLKVIRPGYNATNPPVFTAPFLTHHNRFNDLRFMEWTNTNGHPVSTWDNRTLVSSPSYFVDAGAPWEVCIDLANALKSDLWINVPHLADDAYITSLATLIRDRLAPDLNVYVEHSNEVWNRMFTQYDWNLQQARAAPASLGIAYDGETSDSILNARFHAWRTWHIAQLFEGVFGEGSLNGRVHVVLAGQQTEPSLIYAGLDYLERFFGPPREYIAAIATAPYFNMGDQQYVDGLTPDQIVLALRQHVNNLPVEMLFEANARMSYWFQIPMMAYEGGSDTAGGTSLESKRLALMDPRMYDLCRDYLTGWFSWGFGGFQWFTGGATSWRTPSGAWGLTEDMSVQNTYRVLAVDSLLAQGTVPVTQGFFAPGIFDARRQVDRPADWATHSESLDELRIGQDCDYMINMPYSTTMRVRFGMGCENPGNLMDVLVNGEAVGSVGVPVTGDLHQYAFGPVIDVPFNAGLNVLRLHMLAQGHYSLQSVHVLCPIDLDNNGSALDGLVPDGGVDINDLLVFLELFESGDARGDVDDDGQQPPVRDGGVDVNDLLYFLIRFEAGC